MLATYALYFRSLFARDLVAGVIVAALLVPQSLAYAMLAGLPPHVGLYSSIVPLVAYAAIGSSTSLSVGPVAVLSLMTATTLGSLPSVDGPDYLLASITLAGLTGLILVVLSVFRLGAISNFLSHTVVSGFVTATCILIVLSQLRHVFGVDISGGSAPQMIDSLLSNIHNLDPVVFTLSAFSVVCLLGARSYGMRMLYALGVSAPLSSIGAKLAPIVLMVMAIITFIAYGDHLSSVPLVGALPLGLPHLTLVWPSYSLVSALFWPAVGIALIAYVESVSVAQSLATRKRERIDVNREMAGLGMANIGSALSGGMPVAGGFSRSAVNHEAGSATRFSSVIAAFMVALVSMYFTSFLYYLPKGVLAATIIVAVIGLIDLKTPMRSFTYSKSDFTLILVTILATLVFGVEPGVITGLATSLLLHLYRTSKPHIAEVGLMKGSEHFRNICRYTTQTSPSLLMLRQDESLFFANAHQLEQRVLLEIYKRDAIAHVVIQCSAINEIDFSALEMLRALNQKLLEQGVMLHLSELKGPVHDKLVSTDFLDLLSGQVYLSQFDAFKNLT